MAIIDKVRELMGDTIHLDKERKIREAEAEVEKLRKEVEQLKDYEVKLANRCLNIEAALRRLLKLSEHSWVGPEEMMTIRTCRAILGDETWKK